MNLRDMASELVKMADKIESGVDAHNLEQVVAAIRLRIEGTSARKYSRDAHHVELKIEVTDGAELDVDWKIWDGKDYHNGKTLAAAFAAWKNKWLTKEAITLDVVAGELDPSWRNKEVAPEIATLAGKLAPAEVQAAIEEHL